MLPSPQVHDFASAGRNRSRSGSRTPPRGTKRSTIDSLLESSAPGKAVRANAPSFRSATIQSEEHEDEMADGKNEARAMRILEIMNDFRTLQHHVDSHTQRRESQAPPGSEYLDGYVVLRQCEAESRAILATYPNLGNLGMQGGHISESEVQRATLQRIILDAATRRFQAHKIYLRAAAGTRWVQNRAQVLRGERPNGRHVNALRAVDQRLREELQQITDEHVLQDLRAADRRKRYWIDDDPSLERMLSWIRMQR